MRNGYSTKEIKVSRDHDVMIIPKRKSMVEGFENIIISLYVKGISVFDIEE